MAVIGALYALHVELDRASMNMLQYWLDWTQHALYASESFIAPGAGFTSTGNPANGGEVKSAPLLHGS